MAASKLQPFRFNPRSVTDALDGGQVSPGALLMAQDLIFDPANPFTFECRPAAIEQYDFSDITGAGVVSIAYEVGDICYGMIASSTVPGYDQPFAFNMVTKALVTVSGTQDATTLPLTPTTSGEWVPPVMSITGVLLYVTHPGFSGGADAFFGWFDTTDPTAPVWYAGNTGTNALPAVPSCVGSFNNRAWFSVANNVTFTDALTTNVTNGDQTLTLGDSATNITALVGLPLTTNVQGIIQALAAFKGNDIFLITGDDTTGNLAQNSISPRAVGCSAGRTAVATSKGIKFMATDGVRVVGLDGTLGDPNPDLKVPFIYALSPSRASAAYSNNIYRITVQNGHVNGNPRQEYWHDERQNGWTGPHSFVQDMAVPYAATFIVFNNTLAPSLWTSDVVQTGTSTYVENSVAMQWKLITSPMQDGGGLYENSAILSVLDLQLPGNGDTYSFVASDVANGVLATATIASPVGGPLWGTMVWGQFIWQAISYGMNKYNIPWNNALTFSRLVFQGSGPSSFGFKIGKLVVGYQPLQYIRVP